MGNRPSRLLEVARKRNKVFDYREKPAIAHGHDVSLIKEAKLSV